MHNLLQNHDNLIKIKSNTTESWQNSWIWIFTIQNHVQLMNLKYQPQSHMICWLKVFYHKQNNDWLIDMKYLPQNHDKLNDMNLDMNFSPHELLFEIEYLSQSQSKIYLQIKCRLKNHEHSQLTWNNHHTIHTIQFYVD